MGRQLGQKAFFHRPLLHSRLTRLVEHIDVWLGGQRIWHDLQVGPSNPRDYLGRVRVIAI